jgi:signal peptidase I
MAGFKGTKEFSRKVITNPTFKGIMEFLLLIGVIYCLMAGVATVAFRTDGYWMAVFSGSMTHEDDSWKPYFENQSVRQSLFGRYTVPLQSDNIMTFDTSKFPIQGGFERGDLLFIQGVSSVSEISVGDVLIIDRSPIMPLTHRVLAMWTENGKVRFTTKGDHNTPPYNSQEILSDDLSIRPEQVVGKVIFVVPKIGTLSLWLQGR